VPYQQQIADILAAWRAAERRRDATPDASAEREAAAAEVARLRDVPIGIGPKESSEVASGPE